MRKTVLTQDPKYFEDPFKINYLLLWYTKKNNMKKKKEIEHRRGYDLFFIHERGFITDDE